MILIIGATGKLGGAVAKLLLNEGKPVRAMTRTPEKAEALKKLGAEVVAGDLRDPRHSRGSLCWCDEAAGRQSQFPWPGE
jgi:NADH dehydrogenase